MKTRTKKKSKTNPSYNIKKIFNKIPLKTNKYNLEQGINNTLANYYNSFLVLAEMYKYVYKNINITSYKKELKFNNKFKILYPKTIDILKELHLNGYINLTNEEELYLAQNNYRKLTNAFIKTKNITQTNDINLKSFINNKFPGSNIFNNKYNFYYNDFIDASIEDLLHKETNSYINVKYRYPKLGINNGEINIYYSNGNTYNKNKIKLILARIIFFNEYLSRVGNNINVSRVPVFNIFASSAKKEITSDNTIELRYININSAATDTVENIIIFREEELLKSVLHESIHFHNLDFHFNDYPKKLLNQFLASKDYNLKEGSKLRISEGYTEFLANLLNIIITETEKNNLNIASIKSKKKSISNTKLINKLQLKKGIGNEIKFSIYQNLKLMNYFRGNKFTQINTFPFSYFIIKLQLLLNMKEMLDILNKNNNPKIINLKFENNMFYDMHRLFAFTSDSSSEVDDKFRNIVNNIASIKLKNKFDKSLRMTISDL